MSATQPDPTTLSDDEIRAAVRDRYAGSASTAAVITEMDGAIASAFVRAVKR